MVSIAVAERETGVGKDTLRVWERRYGFPQPVRDARGDRLYPREQIARLRLMKRLMDSGHRPGKIAAATEAELLALSSGNAEVAVAPAKDQGPERLPESLEIDALRRHDAAAFRSLLSQQLARIGLEQIVTESLPRLNALIGNEWAGGRLQIFEEHLYTEQVKALLRQSINNLPTGTLRPRVLLTTVPGEQHVLGVLMVEALLTLRGHSAISLGAQTPLHDIAAAAIAHDVQVVALSFSQAFPARQLMPVVSELRALLPAQVSLWIGGMGVSRYAGNLPGVERLVSLADIGQLLEAAPTLDGKTEAG
ncbi:MAG: MerR family transcriptional regulator [Rhodocyclaceae bacterium]|nr:MerR family transcriptional regulator [Rhodocyclaceae bacterium]MDZ4213623.1 MerR family transcriptional regulator [Rhodocyclaceae bacterium]